jgi:hypothetical protein
MKQFEGWDGKTRYEYEISDMVGKTFTSVKLNDDDSELLFECDLGTFRFYHEQDCCEHVRVYEVIGDLEDLVGEPLLRADEESNEQTPTLDPEEYWDDSATWTFYKFATRKGYVDVRWLGESNGYYSESVNFDFTPKQEESK